MPLWPSRSLLTTSIGVAVAFVGTVSSARAAEPLLPNVEWQASADNVARRIGEIVEHPRAFVRTPDYFGPDRRRKADACH